MSLSEEFNEIIRKNLPEHLSAELRAVLTKAESDATEAVRLRELAGRYEAELITLRPLKSRQQTIDDGLQALAVEKNKFEIEKREWKIQEMEKKYNDVKSLMHDVFRNQRLVYTKTINENVPVDNNHSSYQTRQITGQHTTEVTEE